MGRANLESQRWAISLESRSPFRTTGVWKSHNPGRFNLIRCLRCLYVEACSGPLNRRRRVAMWKGKNQPRKNREIVGELDPSKGTGTITGVLDRPCGFLRIPSRHIKFSQVAGYIGLYCVLRALLTTLSRYGFFISPHRGDNNQENLKVYFTACARHLVANLRDNTGRTHSR